MREEIVNLIADDGHKLFVRKWSNPDWKKPVTGILQINHGMAEHSARYADIAERFVEKGYVVFAQDHRGHGYSVLKGELLGHYADKNGWQKVISDVYQLNEHIRLNFPNAPIILMGHSMGSFIVQAYAIQHGETVDAMVLTGCAYHTPFTIRYAESVMRIEFARTGPKGRSKLIDFLTFGLYNREFSPVRSPADWLSRDPRQVDAYVNDNMCGFLCTNQLWIDLVNGIKVISKPKNIQRIPNKLPILIFSGERDPMSYHPKNHGIKQLAERFKANGQRTVQYKLFPQGRHEILNEVNRHEVVDFWLNWLDHHVPTQKGLEKGSPSGKKPQPEASALL